MTHIIPTDKFTTNILCVLIRRPLCRDEATLTALLPPLLARGSARYPTVRDIRLATEAMQGAVFDAQIIKKGEQQILQFFIEHSPDVSEEAYEFLQEIIYSPRLEKTEREEESFFAPYVAGEGENLRNRIEARVNNKSEYAKLICFENMCHGEPFGLYGDGYAEDIPAITPEGLLGHYNNILSDSPIDIIALGNWPESLLKSKDPAQHGLLTPQPALRPARKERQIVSLNYGTTQGNLCIGLRGEIPPLGMGFIHFQLANEILGGGPSAKLFANVREKESLCYSIFSAIYRFKSLQCIIAGCEPDKLEYVYELSEREVEAVKQGEFSDGDLHSAKQSLSKRWRAMQDNPSACVDFYASQYLLGDCHTVDELLAHVESASRDGICEAAKQLEIDTVVMMK